MSAETELDELEDTASPPDEPIEDEVPNSALVDRLRDRHRKIGERKTVTLDVPGFDDPTLAVEYKKLTWGWTKKLGERVVASRSPRKELLAQADTIINATIEIYVRDGEQLVPARLLANNGQGQDEPVRWDDQLAEILDLEGLPNDPTKRTARVILLKAFSNDLAVSNHHAELTGWMEGVAHQQDEEFAGESPAP